MLRRSEHVAQGEDAEQDLALRFVRGEERSYPSFEVARMVLADRSSGGIEDGIEDGDILARLDRSLTASEEIQVEPGVDRASMTNPAPLVTLEVEGVEILLDTIRGAALCAGV